jgi:ABC-type uncharacterized transport system substrate-binding protein
VRGLQLLQEAQPGLGSVGVFVADVVTIDAQFKDDGGLMSYGASMSGLYKQGAYCVHRILPGHKPADLPVEQPTTFDFVVDLGAARAIGLTIPPTVLQQAGEIIQWGRCPRPAVPGH